MLNPMDRAIELALANVRESRGGPFGAVIVLGGEIVGEGANRVTSRNDPTAHAEILAIRDACLRLRTFDLRGGDIYTSCEPCPMCLGAIYWARLARIHYACTQADARAAGFDDASIYREFAIDPGRRSIPAVQGSREKALEAFSEWLRSDRRIAY
jgi:tRNA(Arg) A34 adenosine deaminase TadA